jgi:copper chaperone CopZ
MNRRKSLFAVGAVIGALALGSFLGVLSEQARAGGTKEAVLAVEGMTCASCAYAVKAALKKLDGVQDAKMSYREKRTAITYEPDRVNPGTMAEAVRKAGFGATVAKSAEGK